MKVETEKLITVHELAKKRGVSTTWIYRLIKAGELKAFKIGRATIVIEE